MSDENKGLEQFSTASAYQFTAHPLNDLQASEYTLVGIALDISSSVRGFVPELEKSMETIAEACKRSQRAENLMIRFTTFNNRLHEVHGYKLLGGIDPKGYNGTIHPSGATSLYDATYESIESLETYGEELTKQGCSTNAIVFIVTDGEDNSSKLKPTQIKALIQGVAKHEHLESLTVVLIGITNNNAGLTGYLKKFADEAGITQFVDVGEMTPGKVAQLATFVSRSISSVSQSLNGGQSQLLTF